MELAYRKGGGMEGKYVTKEKNMDANVFDVFVIFLFLFTTTTIGGQKFGALERYWVIVYFETFQCFLLKEFFFLFFFHPLHPTTLVVDSQ